MLLLIAIVPLAGADSMATIHGAIYEWDTFEPLENVIVEVNSTPPQSMLARYGIYSFNLAPGNYLISASYYRGSTLAYYSEEKITVNDAGDYVIDIIFLPTYYNEEGMNETGFEELDELADLAESNVPPEEDMSSSLPMYVLGLLALLLAGTYLVFGRRTDDNYNVGSDDDISHADGGTTLFSDEPTELPADLREVVKIISDNGGRITQKDLRGRMRHSEAKVSLMVTDLENRGLVQKFKKGRGNVIILIGPEQPNQNI